MNAARPVRAGLVVAVVAAALPLACKGSPHAPSGAPAPSASARARAPAPSSSGAAAPASLAYTELMTGEASANAPEPLVIALHGLGDSPERFLSVFSGFHTPARVVAPHSSTVYGPGYAWFDLGGGFDASAPAVASVATEVATFAAEMARARPTLGKPIVMGFSQGGAISLEIGVHHASAVAAAFPVGSWLAPSLWPEGKPASLTPVTLFHGTADLRVPFETTRLAVAHLQKLGFPVELHVYPGVGHGIPPSLGADLLRAIATECEKQREAGSR